MKNICSHCGAFLPDDATICPKCGTLTAHAPHPGDKKIWEDEPDASPTPPPFVNDTAEPQRHCHIEPIKKREVNKVVMIVAVILIIALALIGYYAVKNASTPTVKKIDKPTAITTAPDSDAHFVVQEISGAEADSIMRSHMAEMEQMEKMMEEMMEGDPFEAFDKMQEMEAGDPTAAEAAHHEPIHKASTPGKIRLVGNVGHDHYVMVLNVKDQNNITGTAAIVAGGKERDTYRLLGIGSGKDLTVSVYGSKNKIVGTLNGTYDGYYFTGVYTTDNGETQFQLMAQ